MSSRPKGDSAMTQLSRACRCLFAALALAFSAGAMAAPPAAAQTLPTMGRETVMYSITPQEVVTVIESWGLIANTITAPDGTPVVQAYADETARAANNPVFIVGMTVCDKAGYPPGCLGMHFARTTRVAAADLGRAKRVADAFHARFSFGRVYVRNGNALVLDYYSFVDHGVTNANVRAIVNEFYGLLREFTTLWDNTP